MQRLIRNALPAYSVSYIHDLSPHHLHGHTTLVYQLHYVKHQMAVHSCLYYICLLCTLSTKIVTKHCFYVCRVQRPISEKFYWYLGDPVFPSLLAFFLQQIKPVLEIISSTCVHC